MILLALAVSGRLVCAGADTMQGVVAEWSRDFHVLQPAAAVVNDQSGKLTADGFAGLLAGKVQVVTFVREAFPAEQAAFQARFGYPLTLLEVGGGSAATKSGTHAIAIYVNAANPLREATLAQLDGIFSAAPRRGAGSLNRWGQLGLTGEWADRPILPYGMRFSRATGNPPGIVNFMNQRLLQGAGFGPQVQPQDDRPGETALDAIVHRVGERLGAIGYSGFAYAAPGAKTLALAERAGSAAYVGTAAEVADRRYPLARQIYLGFNCPPGQPLDPLLCEFLRFVLSPQGQAAVGRSRVHFIPLSPDQVRVAGESVPGLVKITQNWPSRLPAAVAASTTSLAPGRALVTPAALNLNLN
jgi:phosphate transport system substrate-binding protein